ncbi:hypothetical protein Pint_02602 [Pistacia integerrima]|uniref:Uncharacterized protein n=1 Tax=Pistacia integerrima TaxID=434235 RepID=A0ACC0ZM42_9ROSI|nr:hypothetical protein Pint_02602 [Pistacia integerrima]
MMKHRSDREVHKFTEENPDWCSDPHLPPRAAYIKGAASIQMGIKSEDEDDEHHETFCGSCGSSYNSDEFWIGCDICERWYHGKHQPKPKVLSSTNVLLAARRREGISSYIEAYGVTNQLILLTVVVVKS